MLTRAGVLAGCWWVFTASASPACLPFDLPPVDAFVSGPHRVLAHYFNRLPLSIDNRPADRDYYATQYLRADGESGKWRAQGGYLRSRPVPVAVGLPRLYGQENLKHEIVLALSRGIGGFTYDVLSPEDLASGGLLEQMLESVAAIEPRFAVVLMPDMASLGADPEAFRRVVERASRLRGLYHTADGRLLVAPFLAERLSPQQWQSVLTQLDQEGLRIAFLPTFLSYSPAHWSGFASISTGFGSFATPLVSEADSIRRATQATHTLGKLHMAGVPTQGYRPKDRLYWESQGSGAFRASWEAAIGAGADWIQLTTWNDFSESSQVAPYTDGRDGVGTGFFDLNAYYATWFATGNPPEIRRDSVYWFYRRQHVSETGRNDSAPVSNAVAQVEGLDAIDVVTLLPKAARLIVSIGHQSWSYQAAAGLQHFRVPLVEGRPEFTLQRGTSTTALMGNTEIVGGGGLRDGYSDLTYWSGGGAMGGDCANPSH